MHGVYDRGTIIDTALGGTALCGAHNCMGVGGRTGTHSGGRQHSGQKSAEYQ